MQGLILAIPFALIVLGFVFINIAKIRILGKIFLTAGCAFGAFIGLIIGGFILLFSNPYGEFYTIMLLCGLVLALVLILTAIWDALKIKFLRILTVSALGICIAVTTGFFAHRRYVDSVPTVEVRSDILSAYDPYGENSEVKLLDKEAELEITSDFPIMDGATALYPIYSAFARAVYPKYAVDNNSYINCSATTQAYENIVTGLADVIFVAGPSEEQKKFAEENNIELTYTPIGKEAFVFFVNSKNPIEDISIEQIKDIYSGKTKKWNELGIKGMGNIRAFQRDEGSGSQTKLKKLMADRELIVPPKENIVEGMGGIIKKAADYRNYKNAIGYSFRFYSTEMVKNNQIKLLKIDGVYPDTEAIENGSYPITSEFYAVTRSGCTENTKKLVDWICSHQGAELIEKTGYTAIKR